LWPPKNQYNLRIRTETDINPNANAVVHYLVVDDWL
jgi:hypothetical protein